MRIVTGHAFKDVMRACQELIVLLVLPDEAATGEDAILFAAGRKSTIVATSARFGGSVDRAWMVLAVALYTLNAR
jgi:hypothetical protein